MGGDTESQSWALHNGLGPGLNFSHHLAAVFNPALFSRHSEYFPWVEQRRLQPPAAGLAFWNPDLGRTDVAAFAAQSARDYFQAQPSAISFSLGVNDGLIFGESPELLALLPRRAHPAETAAPGAADRPVSAWFRGRPDYSNLVFTFMNRAATDLARTQPSKLLGALAYYWCENTPDFPVHAQVVPFLTADRAQGYDPAYLREENSLQARWAQAGPRRLGLYDYLYGRGFLIPRYHPHLLASNLRAARRLGFTDYYAEVYPNWGLDGPQPWLVAQLLQDPEAEVDVLLDEYFVRYFQEAAGPMRRFYERCESQWLGQSGRAYWLKHYRNESQADIFPPAVCAVLRKSLDEAAQAAGSSEVRQRVALVSAAFRATQRFVEFQVAREQLTTAALRGRLSGRAGLGQVTAYRHARSASIAQLVRMHHQTPLALFPSDFRDFFVNDPLFAAGTALLQTTQRERPAELAEVEAGVRSAKSPALTIAWQSWRHAANFAPVADLTLAGARQPARQIAGLVYGLELPPPWQSRVEPAEDHRASWAEPGKILRVSGTTDTAFYQWLPAQAGRLYAATVKMRGRLSSSAAVTLTLGWLDPQNRPLGYAVLRLPVGEPGEWSELRQGGVAPAGAAWVGVGVRLQHQEISDWVEIQTPTLSVETGQ